MHRHFSNHLHGRYLKSGQASHTRKKLLERVRPGIEKDVVVQA